MKPSERLAKIIGLSGDHERELGQIRLEVIKLENRLECIRRFAQGRLAADGMHTIVCWTEGRRSEEPTGGNWTWGPPEQGEPEI